MEWFNAPNPYQGLTAQHSDFPSILPLSEATDWVADLKESEVLLGVDGKGRPLTADFDAESPHILVSAPTGAGKSSVARSVAVQRLMKGDMVVVLDIKRHSHRWARNLAPNVIYAKDPQDIGGTLVRLGMEVRRRNQVVDDWEGPVETAPVGQRIIVLYEEQNATQEELKELDKRLPTGSYSSRQGHQDIVFMGRAVKVHMVSFAQLASRRASGGAEVIENYGTKILINHSVTAWKWLAADCGPMIPSPEEPGRCVVTQGGKARTCQSLWVPEQDAERHVLDAPLAQRRARQLSGSRTQLPPVWREAIGR